MDELSSKQFERTAGPVYFLALLFLGLSFIDYVMNVWPLSPSVVNWRYGAVGLLGGFLLTPLLGLVVLLCASILYGHRGVRLATGTLSAFLAVVLALGMMLFILDTLQVRPSVAVDAKWSFDVTAFKAIVKLLTGIICTGWIALVAFGKAQDAARARRAPAAPLVVGASERA